MEKKSISESKTRIIPQEKDRKEEGMEKIERAREKMQEEALNLLTQQQQKEIERQSLLHKANDQEKKRLGKIFGIERAEESEQIILLSGYIT